MGWLMQEEIAEGDRNQDSHQILNPLAGNIDKILKIFVLL